MATSMPREAQVRYLLVGSVVVTVIAFFYTIATKPKIPDWQREEDPHKYGFPTWYNAMDAISPYDSPPVSSGWEDGLDVLLFIDLPHNSPSLPNAFYTLDVLEAQPDIAVRAIGRFAPPWRKSLSVAKNLDQAGCGQVLWRIGDGPANFGNACPDSIIIDEVGLHTARKPKINPRANITLISNALHVPKEDGSGPADVLVAEVPPAADPSQFGATRMVPSHRALTFFPRPTTPYEAWPKMPKGCTLYQQRSPPQPPDTVMRKMNRWDIFEPASAFRSFWRGYDVKLGLSLAHAGVCVFEDWSDGVVDARVAQAMLSGCLVAMVPPNGPYKHISDLILPLTPNGDTVPLLQVTEALKNITDSDLLKTLVQAFSFARQSLVGNTRLSAVLEVLRRWEQGDRGHTIEYGYRPLCEGNDSRPSWCD